MLSHHAKNSNLSVVNSINEPEATSVGGIKIRSGTDDFLLTSIIQKSLHEFQLNQDSNLDFKQKAITIHIPKQHPTEVSRAEIINHVKVNNQNWFIRELPLRSDTPGIFANLSHYKIIQHAVKSGILRISPLRILVLASVVFVITFLVTFLVPALLDHQSIFFNTHLSHRIAWAFFLACSTGIVAYALLRRIQFSKNAFLLSVCAAVKAKRDTAAYKVFTKEVANLLIDNLPLVVVVDDISQQDHFTMDVISSIVKKNVTECAGALQWIVFNSSDNAHLPNPFLESSLQSKQWSISLFPE